jgi:hypothetical protein
MWGNLPGFETESRCSVRSNVIGDSVHRRYPREGWRALSARVSLRLLSLRDSPRGHEVFHHGALLELVFDVVHMVWTDRFEKFLKVLFWLSCLALEVMLGGRDILLIGSVRFLVVVITTGSNCDPLGRHFCVFLLPLEPFLAPLPVALDGAPSCCWGPFSIALNKDGPDRHLTRCVSGGDIKQLLGGLLLITTEFMH